MKEIVVAERASIYVLINLFERRGWNVDYVDLGAKLDVGGLTKSDLWNFHHNSSLQDLFHHRKQGRISTCCFRYTRSIRFRLACVSISWQEARSNREYSRDKHWRNMRSCFCCEHNFMGVRLIFWLLTFHDLITTRRSGRRIWPARAHFSVDGQTWFTPQT